MIHLGSWNVILSEVVRFLGAFWEDFELDLELFGIPKVTKRVPKSIPDASWYSPWHLVLTPAAIY